MEAPIERESELAAFFVELSQALVGEYELQDFLQTLVDGTAGLVGAAAVGILMTREDGGLQLTVATSAGMERLEDFELMQQQGPCYEAYVSGEQRSEVDLDGAPERWPEFTPQAVALGYRSVHGFPLWVRGEALGALNVFFSDAGQFEKVDVRAVQALADVAAIGISQQRAASRRRTRQQDAIAELGRAALGALSDEGVLTRVVETVRDVLGLETVSILALDPVGELAVRAVAGAAANGAATAIAPDVAEVADGALRQGRTVVAVPRRGEPTNDALPSARTTAAAVIGGRDRDFGVVTACFGGDRSFDAGDVAFLESVATLVASILDRQQVEAHLRQTQKLEAVGQLAGGVAHDFNNLLQIIHGNAELLELDRSTDETSAILTATEQGRRLVERLLMFSRQRPPAPRLVALNDDVAKLTHMLDRMVGDTITIDIDLASEVCAVLIDETQLEQAIINLVINARDAMPDGGRITVATALADPGELPAGATGTFARLTVTDTGTGMSDAVLEQVLQPFFTTKPDGKGTGLGLSSVYGAVTAAGGHLDIRSSLGSGTAVDLFLPHDTTIPEPHDLSAPEPMATAAHVLVVEDRPEIGQLVASALTHLGMTVRSADDAESALELIADGGPPDLLITDVTLPGLQGPALAEQLRAHHPNIRVLYMSGYPAGDQVATGDAFLHKPFTLAQLTEQVQATLR